MENSPLSLVPIRDMGARAQCAWSPEPVFPLEDAARILGVRKDNLLRHIRHRHPEVKLEEKVFTKLANTFGPSLSEFGEVKIRLRTPGGPQEHVCLTHYGLFRHAIYIRTPQARSYAIRYPEFRDALREGRLRGPRQVAGDYQYILEAPRGQKTPRTNEIALKLGKSPRTVQRHVRMIVEGRVTPDGMPRFRRPGPKKGFRAGVPRRAVRYLAANNF